VSELPVFAPEELLQRLVDSGVQFIVIGGLAAQAHGSTSVTQDLDIVYSRDRENLERIADVLREVTAIRRGLPADAPPMPPLDASTLRATSLLTLQTRFGPLDLLANPDPGFDYETLLEHAERARIAGVTVLFAGLDDLIAMKRAAGRPKDRVELEILGALRDEIDRREPPGHRVRERSASR
jgi:predicted nucleotidyltransferase